VDVACNVLDLRIILALALDRRCRALEGWHGGESRRRRCPWRSNARLRGPESNWSYSSADDARTLAEGSWSGGAQVATERRHPQLASAVRDEHNCKLWRKGEVVLRVFCEKELACGRKWGSVWASLGLQTSGGPADLRRAQPRCVEGLSISARARKLRESVDLRDFTSSRRSLYTLDSLCDTII